MARNAEAWPETKEDSKEEGEGQGEDQGADEGDEEWEACRLAWALGDDADDAE